jgi:hypothetical protein
MKNVAVLAFNTVYRDARITKEARVLVDAGYGVRIFGLSDKNNPAGLRLSWSQFSRVTEGRMRTRARERPTGAGPFRQRRSAG